MKFVRTAATAALCWSTCAMSAAPATQSGSFHLSAPPAQVFGYFSAEGERAWAPGWEPQLLSGAVERGSVFRTHAHGRDTTWIVTDYRADSHRVSYARLVDGMNMGLVDVACDPDGNGTRVSVRYTLTPTAPAGAPLVDEFLAAPRYGEFLREWQDAIGKLLAASTP